MACKMDFYVFLFLHPFLSLFKSKVSKKKFWEIRLLHSVPYKNKTSGNISSIAVQS